MARYDKPDEPYFDEEEVIGSALSYHRPTCFIIRQIYQRNYKRFRSWRAAHELGLKPCTLCSPYSPPATESAPSAVRIDDSAPPSGVSTITVDQLTELRRELLQVLDAVDARTPRPRGELVGARITRLSKDGVIPRELTPLMRTITEMRNAAEYESKALSLAESAAVSGAWLSIKEWAIGRGVRLPRWIVH